MCIHVHVRLCTKQVFVCVCEIEKDTLTCPCPREMALKVSPLKPLSSANLSSPAMGSAPGERTNSRGTVQLESA